MSKQYIIIANKNFLGCELFIKHGIGSKSLIVSEDFVRNDDIVKLISCGAIRTLPVNGLTSASEPSMDKFIPEPVVPDRKFKQKQKQN